MECINGSLPIKITLPSDSQKSNLSRSPRRILESKTVLTAVGIFSAISSLYLAYQYFGTKVVLKRDVFSFSTLSKADVLGLIGSMYLAYQYFGDKETKIVLKRDALGFYTLPKVDVPGFKNMGTFRGREINIRAGSFIVDTANGIVPVGWVLE